MPEIFKRGSRFIIRKQVGFVDSGLITGSIDRISVPTYACWTGNKWNRTSWLSFATCERAQQYLDANIARLRISAAKVST
jgi:hypothetical protein